MAVFLNMNSVSFGYLYEHNFKALCMFLDICTKDKSIKGKTPFYAIYGKITEIKF